MCRRTRDCVGRLQFLVAQDAWSDTGRVLALVHDDARRIPRPPPIPVRSDYIFGSASSFSRVAIWRGSGNGSLKRHTYFVWQSRFWEWFPKQVDELEKQGTPYLLIDHM